MIQRSFIGGEVAPEMLARIDDPRVQNGAALLRNMQVTTQGVAYKRPGRRFVNKCRAGHTSPVRVISYRVSSSQTVGVEMGTGNFRFHTARAPIVFTSIRNVSAVSIANDTITFAKAHGWLNDDRVRVVEITGSGAVPTGVSESTSYYAVVIDTHTIKLSTTPGGGAIVDITGTGSGTIIATDSSTMPADYASPKTVTAGSTVTNEFTFASAHNISTGDQVYLNAFVGGSVPTLIAGQVWYARATASDKITLHPSVADAQAATNTVIIALFTSAAMRKNYPQGSIVLWPGAGKGFFYCHASPNDDPIPVSDPPSATNRWYRMPDTGEYEIPTPYDNSDTFQITYDQDENVLTLAHRDYAPRQLRLSGSTWTLTTVTFGPALAAPVLSSGVASRGTGFSLIEATVASPALFKSTLDINGIANYDVVFLSNNAGTQAAIGTNIVGFTTNTFYRFFKVDDDQFNLLDVGSMTKLNNTGSAAVIASDVRLHQALLSAELSHVYQVTAVDANGRESLPSNTITMSNNLLIDGAFNEFSWTAVTGAARYRVYKKKQGIFGLIADTELAGPAFRDDNIDPDLTFNLPTQDTSLSGSDHPGAVGHFEQRCAFGGTTLFPQGIWLTPTGTNSELSFHIPVQDTDRVQVQLSVGRRVDIRHIVSFGHLVILSDGAEMRMTPLNSDALTPSSASVRPQSFVGCSYVRPQTGNSTIVFAAARGGHVFDMGFRQEAGGFITNDICLRATHLFDDRQVLDSAYISAPQSSLWFVSSTGQVLGCTYVPEEQIVAWHQHDTDGVVESTTSVGDPGDDVESLLVVTKRTINGVTERFVECSTRERLTGVDAFFVDAGLSFDGRTTNYSGTPTVTIQNGFNWGPDDVLTVETSVPMFRAADVGALLRVTSGGVTFTLTVLGFTDALHVTARVDKTLPVALRNTATTAWEVARSSFTGLAHLEGKSIRGLADGAPFTATVSNGGFTLASPAAVVHAGLGYTAEIRTVPIIAQIDSATQGMKKNVVRAVMRMASTAPFTMGFTGERTVPVRSTDIIDGVARVPLGSNWNELGQVTILQEDPLPLTIVGATLEVAVSGY